VTAIVVADERKVSLRTVQRLYGEFAERGEEAIPPRYDECGSHQSRGTCRVILDEALELRKQHPTWGAPLIQIKMRQAQPRRALPSPRTLQRWFEKQAAPAAPTGRRPALAVAPAERPHEVWQMDAVEKTPLATGQGISWLRIVDEWTGAVLDTRVFNQSSFASVGTWTVQTQLRRVFSRWGRPERFRVDNGTPWGSSGDLPTDLALWLIGLELTVIWNPPRQPQKNGKVERSQGVGQAWAEPWTCRSAGELQRRLHEMDRIQREEYPHCDGRSRWSLFPELKHSGRSYDEIWERRHWKLELVLDHVAQYLISRQVDQGGKVSIYNQNYYVGRQHHGEIVSVMLDPQRCVWVILDAEGRELRTHPAEQLTRERIVNLQVNRRPKKAR
jgi:hypothetical protein